MIQSHNVILVMRSFSVILKKTPSNTHLIISLNIKPQIITIWTYVLTFKNAEICGLGDYEKSMFSKFGDSAFC